MKRSSQKRLLDVTAISLAVAIPGILIFAPIPEEMAIVTSLIGVAGIVICAELRQALEAEE